MYNTINTLLGLIIFTGCMVNSIKETDTIIEGRNIIVGSGMVVSC